MTSDQREHLILRPVTLEDANVLREWRNDLATRHGSRETDRVTVEEHAAWLGKSLGESTKLLRIVEKNGVPIGVVRADLVDGVHELSWTVAPGVRGRGYGKKMVAQFARELTGPIRAVVRVGNPASAKIAEFLGMRLEREADGFLYYLRERSRG